MHETTTARVLSFYLAAVTLAACAVQAQPPICPTCPPPATCPPTQVVTRIVTREVTRLVTVIVTPTFTRTPTRTATPSRTPTRTPTSTLTPVLHTSTGTPTLMTRGLGVLTIATPTPTAASQRKAGPQIVIVQVDKGEEWIELKNAGTQDQDMGGWRVLSILGAQEYTFEGHTVLEPGASIRLWSGARAEEEAKEKGGLVWTKKNVWNNSESDPAELYNASGELVDRYPRE